MSKTNLLLKTPLLLITIALMMSINNVHAAEDPLFQPLSPRVSDLSQYRWHHRPLVIFAPSKTDPAYVAQMAMLEKQKSELADAISSYSVTPHRRQMAFCVSNLIRKDLKWCWSEKMVE